MIDYTKGGRGKAAPYKTTHCRIPEDIKGIVDQLISLYKRFYDSDCPPNHNDLIASMQKAINSMAMPDDADNTLTKDVNTIIKDVNRIPQVGEKWVVCSPNMVRPAIMKCLRHFDDGSCRVIDETTNTFFTAPKSWMIACFEELPVNNLLDKDNAIRLAKELLKGKGVGKIKLEKLLTAIYDEDIVL